MCCLLHNKTPSRQETLAWNLQFLARGSNVSFNSLGAETIPCKVTNRLHNIRFEYPPPLPGCFYKQHVTSDMQFELEVEQEADKMIHLEHCALRKKEKKYIRGLKFDADEVCNKQSGQTR